MTIFVLASGSIYHYKEIQVAGFTSQQVNYVELNGIDMWDMYV